jgi:DNA-3-methyladenine glycosylase II
MGAEMVESDVKIARVRSHFEAVDRKIYALMGEVELEPLRLEVDASKYFARLCREIIGQQLSSKVARVIAGRFVDLFPGREITPERVLTLKDEDLRGTGISWAKVNYIRDLALKTRQGEVDFGRLAALDDKRVIEELTRVKGVGRWTAEMFLIFTLGREDVFSHGDLGLRRGVARLYDLRESDGDLEGQIEEITRRWSPYRSYGCLALWGEADKT